MTPLEAKAEYTAIARVLKAEIREHRRAADRAGSLAVRQRHVEAIQRARDELKRHERRLLEACGAL